MPRTIVVVGFGPGISTAVADRFGAEGYQVALVARTGDRLAAGVEALAAKGVAAAAFQADAADPASIRAAIGAARAALGPVSVLHWNAFGGHATGDLLAADPAAVGGAFDVAVVGLLAAVQEALPDLKAAQGGLLVTNGAFGENAPPMDAMAVTLKTMGVALANAAKYKLVGLLAQQLKTEGVYVGEVMVAGAVKGTAWAREGGIDPALIAGAFWDLLQARGETRARVSQG
jgi:NAD(P)-dependent dehydrogenase (short-subunit alcohol dehydrogenase family)